MKEIQEKLLALSADAYSQHQTRGDSFALRVADVTAGLALKVKQLAVRHSDNGYEVPPKRPLSLSETRQVD